MERFFQLVLIAGLCLMTYKPVKALGIDFTLLLWASLTVLGSLFLIAKFRVAISRRYSFRIRVPVFKVEKREFSISKDIQLSTWALKQFYAQRSVIRELKNENQELKKELNGLMHLWKAQSGKESSNFQPRKDLAPFLLAYEGSSSCQNLAKKVSDLDFTEVRSRDDHKTDIITDDAIDLVQL